MVKVRGREKTHKGGEIHESIAIHVITRTATSHHGDIIDISVVLKFPNVRSVSLFIFAPAGFSSVVSAAAMREDDASSRHRNTAVYIYSSGLCTAHWFVSSKRKITSKPLRPAPSYHCTRSTFVYLFINYYYYLILIFFAFAFSAGSAPFLSL